ncbi:MAG: hypothetical protein ACM3S5_14445 [Rhodospirillales bacterium]
MSSAAVPIGLLESRTQAVLVATAAKPRRNVPRVSAWLAFAPSLRWLVLLAAAMPTAVRSLSVGCGGMQDAQEIRKLAHRVNQLHQRLIKMLAIYDQAGLRDAFPYRMMLDVISKHLEALGSIAEGLYMCLDEDFQRIIDGTVAELRDVALSRRPPVAQMQS